MSTLRVKQARMSLEPLRIELLRRARAEAQRTLAEARDEVAEGLRQAQAHAADIIADARAQGEAQAAAESAAQRSHGRRARRGEILATQQRAYHQLSSTAAAAVCDLRTEPGYPVLRDSLRDTAIHVLGGHTSIADDPAGGIVAAAGGRRLDLSLPTIASRALRDIEPEIGGLWA